MTTWTSSRACVAALCLVLAGCEGGTGIGVLDGIGRKGPVPLSQAKMADGAMTLVPPQGFCIDKATLRQNFALMTGCGALGAPSAAAGAPIGILTVSVTGNDNADLPTPQEIANAAKLTRVSAVASQNGTQTFLAEGTPPVDGLGAIHWRGTARIGGEVLGVALYGPTGGRSTSPEGRQIIESLVRRSASSS